jgi:membrane-associated phospholipid phosphatase
VRSKVKRLSRETVLEFLSLSLIVGLATSIGALVFFAWLADEVLEGETQRFDSVTREAVHQLASPALTSAMRGISFLGSTIFLTIATTVVVALFLKRRWKREAILFVITMVGASVLNVTLKLAFQRQRPTPYFSLLPPESYSFPSGHSLGSCCFYGALAALLAARAYSLRTKVLLWICGILMFLTIGLSRIYLGVHYTTDVIAGFVAAFFWVMVVGFVENQLRRLRSRRREQRASTEFTDSTDFSS